MASQSTNVNFYSIPAPPVFFLLNSIIFFEHAANSSLVCLLFGRLHIGQISSLDVVLGGLFIITTNLAFIIYSILQNERVSSREWQNFCSSSTALNHIPRLQNLFKSRCIFRITNKIHRFFY